MINERRHINDNGFVSHYWYDAAGERTVKTSGDGEVVYVNSLFSGGRTGTSKFSLYVSPYLVASQGGKYTKHIYVGSQRIVSKLGDLQSYGADPRRIPYAGSESDNISVDYKGKYQKQQQVIKDNYATFEVPYNGLDNDNYVDGDGFCCSDNGATTRSLNPGQNDNYELAQFYYHPDHLGSSSFITNLDGDVAQHIEYVPFGEVFIEERNNVWNTPYLFNAKELDEETGLYYYGARYYDSRISLWLSTDQLQEKYPGISSYCYTFNNPIKFVDFEGKEPIKSQAGTMMGFIKFLNNTRTKMGTLTGTKAHDAMMRLGKTEMNWKHFRPEPKTTNPFNTSKDKYIYTKQGGWLDMAHFMFYAGRAYDYKQRKNAAQKAIDIMGTHPMASRGISASLIKEANMDPIAEAVQDGYIQEMSDRLVAKHSAYSYEDLPSDKFGADFGANHFDPNSNLSLGEQLQTYLEKLGATNPENAPNYKKLPDDDLSLKVPTRTNHTTKPVYTKENP